MLFQLELLFNGGGGGGAWLLERWAFHSGSKAHLNTSIGE